MDTNEIENELLNEVQSVTEEKDNNKAISALSKLLKR